MRRDLVNILSSYVDALRPIIYINHFDFHVVDELISKVADIEKAKIYEFNNALGMRRTNGVRGAFTECDLESFLKNQDDNWFEENLFLVLKDIHKSLENPRIIALLQRIAEQNMYHEGYHITVFIVSAIKMIPQEIENYITILDYPLPSDNEIVEIIRDFAEDLDISVDSDTADELALSFRGLNEFQIQQILALAYQDGGNITKDDKQLILSEKEQFIKKSGMLELVNFKETINDIGGLEGLKTWLNRKKEIFHSLDQAVKFGVDIPKGIMIAGMPGCGKSLTAKATASLFQIPLVRLDVGRLLGKYVGESEENMRRALAVAEAISPCVLWIDEIEKAFAGIGHGDGGHEVTTRLFGQFLTWMQEKESTVFIVATSNSIKNMPPEFLRKGRFDELFFVDLPDKRERKKIIEIHLKKRNKWNDHIDFLNIVEKTEGFNGADIEAMIKDAIEEAFLYGYDTISTVNLSDAAQGVKSISKVLGNKIDELKKDFEKYELKNASKVLPINKKIVKRSKTDSTPSQKNSSKDSAHEGNIKFSKIFKTHIRDIF